MTAATTSSATKVVISTHRFAVGVAGRAAAGGTGAGSVAVGAVVWTGAAAKNSYGRGSPPPSPVTYETSTQSRRRLSVECDVMHAFRAFERCIPSNSTKVF